jgi:hypothetical protein
MPDPKKSKKKKVSTTPDKSPFVQVGAGKGVSRYVKKDSPEGKQYLKASKLLKLKESGKKLLRSEEYLVNKHFNTTKKKKGKRTFKTKTKT